MYRSLVIFVTALLCANVVHAQSTAKRPLDHDAYDSWKSIDDEELSNDGRWVLYVLEPQEGDAQLRVRSLRSSDSYMIPRGREARFSDDDRFVVFLIEPELAAVREAKKEAKEAEEKGKEKEDSQPKDSLGILDLTTGEVSRMDRVQSFELPEDAGGWVAYLFEKPKEEEEEPSEKDEEEKQEGTVLVLRNLSSGQEQRFQSVTEYEFSDDGKRLAYSASSKDGSADGAFVLTLADTQVTTLMSGEGVYKGVTFDESGERVAFLSNRDDYEADQPAFVLYSWRVGSREARAVASDDTPGVLDGWWVSEHGDLEFSENGRRLFFGTAPRPAPEPDEEIPDWEKVELDVWNWRDPFLQPMQLVRRDQELKRTYLAVVHLDDERVVQLADEALPHVTVGSDGDADVALGIADVPYRQLISWDSPDYYDVQVVDVTSGARRMIREKLQGDAELSPDAKYVTWWNGHEMAWFAASVNGGEPVNLTEAVPHPVHNELHDWPMIPRPYGDAGWTENDGWFLIYDKHDIWATDPTGRRPPRNVTEGIGRQRNLRFRYVRLDREQDAIPERDPMLLRTFDLTTKASGLHRDRFRGDGEPRELIMADRRFGLPRKADDADVVMVTRESFQEFPDLWVSNLSFGDMQKVTDANPQQAEYLWGTPELIHWRSTDGKALEGILYKPENFDVSKKYPMMVYFYEKNADNLHRHRSPVPGRSSISIGFYVSRGYVVFVPDVHYRVGYPGESALDCVVSGVLSVLEKGFVDSERIGVQGHSWGGYQIAYLVTQTNIFRAAEAGAPVSNMTSAYGGIRWGSGRSRMFQYERSQSRLGGSLWEARRLYVENSPLFWADKIETPVLMMHNDDDGAVPWYQGIEFFVALRRLGKPAWLLNYNGEPHGLQKYQNKKDWAVRMQQFFDHYLKDAPAPVWLAEGVPAVEKGKTLGLEFVEAKPRTTTGSRNEPPRNNW